MLCLLDNICAVRQRLGCRIPVLVHNNVVSIGGLRSSVASCRLQVDIELSANFGCDLSGREGFLDAGRTDIRVLENLNVALDDLFCYAQIGGCIDFDDVVLRLSAYLIYTVIQQIADGRNNFLDGPIIAANIDVRSKLSIRISGVLFHQFVAIIQAINGALQGGVALRCRRLDIALCNGHRPLLQHIMNRNSCGLIQLYIDAALYCRNDIPCSGVNFLQRVVVTHKNIIEGCNAGSVRHSHHVYALTLCRSTCQVELDALNDTVFRGLGHTHCTASQLIMHISVRSFIQCYIYARNDSRYDILFGGANFPNGIVLANQNVREGCYAFGIGGSGHIHRVTITCRAGQSELDAGNQPVLSSLRNSNRSASQLVVNRSLRGFPHSDYNTVLHRRDNIAGSRINLRQNVAAAHQHILEFSNARCIGSRIQRHRSSRCRGAFQMELHAGHKSVFRRLGNAKTSTRKVIVEGQLRSVVDPHGNAILHIRNNVAGRGAGLLYCVPCPNGHIGEGRNALSVRLCRHADGRPRVRSTCQRK